MISGSGNGTPEGDAVVWAWLLLFVALVVIVYALFEVIARVL